MENNTAAKVEKRAQYLASLAFPSTPWTDADHKRFQEASDKWDRWNDRQVLEARCSQLEQALAAVIAVYDASNGQAPTPATIDRYRTLLAQEVR